MLNARVEQVVAASPPSAEVALILEVDTEEAETAAAKIKDLVHRMKTLRAIYREAKEPLLDAVTRYRSQGIDVVDELPSTSQIIVSGPAAVWRVLIDDNRELLDKPTVNVFTNEAHFSEI